MEPSRIGLVVGVVVGLVLAGLGSTARGLALRPDLSYEDRVDQWMERDDGTVIIYDYEEPEGEAWQPRYEVVAVDESTSVVSLVDRQLGVRIEVFRGNTAEAETVYGSGEDDFQLVSELIDESTVVVYRTDEQRDVRIEVFRGPLEEAETWWRDHFGVVAFEGSEVVVFEGSRAEAEAWVDAEREPPRDVFLAELIIGAGVVAILAGLALAWPRAPRRLIFTTIGAAIGLLPAAVLRVFVESPLIEESEPELGGLSGSLAITGLVLGGVLGFVYGERSKRDATLQGQDRRPPRTSTRSDLNTGTT